MERDVASANGWLQRLGLAALMAWAGVAVAAPRESAPQVTAAEVLRLSHELHTLATRNAWAGVERTWTALREADDLSVTDFVVAAEAARALGDLGASRERLLAALELEERREIVEQLWAIDMAYGAVHVTAPGPVLLEPPGADFFPVARGAIERATSALADSGQYQGWLPVGRYTIGNAVIDVRPGPRPIEVELR
ncbi:MAG: hypothetical protein ACI9K2_003338 [Myxococcota bacterium]|jgi:hypothetical protein